MPERILSDKRTRAEKYHDWYVLNREKNLEYQRAWRKENKARKSESDKEYRRRNAATIAAQAKDRAKRNRESITRRQSAWNQANRERLSENAKHRYERDHQARLDKQRRWRNENREQHKLNARIRRARKAGSDEHHTVAEVEALWERQKHKCAVPGCIYKIASKGKNKYHIDHVTPLSKGGSDGIWNLQLLCRRHNLEKYDRDETEWARRIGMLFVM
jgi:hypothetical protein